MIVQGKCDVLTLNVRGLRNRVKRRSIFCFLKDQNCDVYFLQETYSEQKDEIIWRGEWGGDILFSHGSLHSRGVCILMNPALNYTFENIHKDQTGRIISIDLYFNENKLSLCNVYVPNDQRQQQAFLHNLSTFLMSNTDIENLLIGGDWNISLQAIDKKGGSPWKPTTSREQLVTMMEEFDLVDVFRAKNPNKKSYTYESKALKLYSRLDFFLLPQHLIHLVEQIETLVSNAPDHRAVKLKFKCSNNRRGPGLWKFNNSLLDDEEYVNLIRGSYSSISEKYAGQEDKRLKWELVKLELRGLTIPYAKNKAKNLRKKEKDLQTRLSNLDQLISNSVDSAQVNYLEVEYFQLKQELCLIYENKGKGSIVRSKTKWTEQGEKPTKYFFNLERRNYNHKTIRELKYPDGTLVTKEDEILKEIEIFYNDLYTSSTSVENALFQSFIANLEIPKLEDSVSSELEGEITLRECKDILCTFSSGKSPGEDGFTWEFYNCFFDLLGQDLVDCFNASYRAGEMSLSQRRGVITLIPKEDSDLSTLANWRPITLLNLDYKIASKIIARRLEKVLALLINPDQTGFIKGRYIGQNIRLINDILEQTKLQNIPGILLQLDFRKAFDTIEWEFIQRTIALFNFGESIQRWISIFYTNTESAVLNNGFCTNYFSLSRGVRQGCPLSPYLFVLAVELLACKIRQDKEIQGIKVLGKELKLSQFADDTTLLNSNCNSVKQPIAVLDNFGDISGLKLNPSKTKALWLGSWRHRKDKPFGFQWPEKPIRVLGTFISYNEKENEKSNFTLKLQKLKTIFDVWNCRNLTIFGICLITKSLGILQLVHTISSLDVPREFLGAVNSTIFKFIWKNKKDKLKRKLMILDYDQGGLRAPSIDVLVKSLKLAWISRLLTDEPTCRESWKTIPNYFFEKCGGLNFLLRCNYDKYFLEQIDLPQFYKLILLYFLEIKESFPNQSGQELILFNNKDILINGRTIFYRDWFDRGIYLVRDLLKSDGKFLSYTEFVQKYDLRCNFLIYFQVVSAIPRHLVERAMSYPVDRAGLLSSTMFHLSPETSINLTKMKNKDYYQLLVNKEKIEPKATSKWERDLQVGQASLQPFFSRVRNVCRDNKLREFYFKLLHRIVVTKKELFLFGVAEDAKCPYCELNDSIIHTFHNCDWSQLFFAEVIKWFNKENATSLTLSPTELIFGKDKDNINKELPVDIIRKLNFTFLYAKYYLYNQKLLNRELSLNEFLANVIFKYNFEKFKCS